MKSGFKKRHRNRFPPRWAVGYPFAWLGFGRALAIYRKAHKSEGAVDQQKKVRGVARRSSLS